MRLRIHIQPMIGVYSHKQLKVKEMENSTNNLLKESLGYITPNCETTTINSSENILIVSIKKFDEEDDEIFG